MSAAPDFDSMSEAELDTYIAVEGARLAAKREFLDRVLPLMGIGETVADALDRMTPGQRVECEALMVIAYPDELIRLRGGGS